MKIVVDIFKKIVVLFGMFVGIVDAMDHAISRRESKFDCLKLHELSPWCEKLSAEQKAALQTNLEKQDEKSKALFKFATQLPVDVQKLVVAHMFDGYSYTRCCKDGHSNSLGEYEGAVNKFYAKPIRVVFDYHIETVNFINLLKKEWEKNRRWTANDRVTRWDRHSELRSLIDNPNPQQHIIFELLEDLLFAAERRKRCYFYKRELQSVERVVNRLPDMMRQVDGINLDWIDFRYHDVSTLDNFKKRFSREQWAFLPFFLLPFVSKLIAKPWYEDYEYIDQNIVEKNNIKEFMNAHLQGKYNETGDSIWLSGVKQLKNPLVETWKVNDDAFVKKIAIYLSGVPLLIMIVGGCSFSDMKRMKQDGRLLENGGCVGIYSIISGGAVFLIKSFLEYIVPRVMEPLLERPLLSIGCVTGLYALTVAFHNFIEMRSWREGRIAGKDLSALLRRTDIVIE